MKRFFAFVVIGLIMFFGVGNLMPASISNTALAIRHASTGAANTAVLAGPGNLYLLASKIDANNWAFACVNGGCDAVRDFIKQKGGSGNLVSASTWEQFVAAITQSGWRTIQASQLPETIRATASQPSAGEYFKMFMQWVLGLGGGALAAKKAK